MLIPFHHLSRGAADFDFLHDRRRGWLDYLFHLFIHAWRLTRLCLHGFVARGLNDLLETPDQQIEANVYFCREILHYLIWLDCVGSLVSTNALQKHISSDSELVRLRAFNYPIQVPEQIHFFLLRGSDGNDLDCEAVWSLRFAGKRFRQWVWCSVQRGERRVVHVTFCNDFGGLRDVCSLLGAIPPLSLGACALGGSSIAICRAASFGWSIFPGQTMLLGSWLRQHSAPTSLLCRGHVGGWRALGTHSNHEHAESDEHRGGG